MSYFLNRTFNLADLENTTNARLNLNIGDISTQRHYDVNILGGNMTVEHFSINNPTDTVQVKDMYLICSNDIGDVHFDDIDRHIPNWANKYQNNVPISAFSNDLMLAFDLHKSAQNNSIFSIDNRLYYLHDFINSNDFFKTDTIFFSDNVEKPNTISNLKIDNMAFQNANHLYVDNIDIYTHLYIQNSNIDYELLTTNDEFKIVYSNIPTATEERFGTVKITNDEQTMNTDECMTSHLLCKHSNNMYYEIQDTYDMISSRILDNREGFTSILKSDTCYDADTNLKHIVDVTMGRSNLGLGDISILNRQNIYLNTLNVSKIYNLNNSNTNDINGYIINSNNRMTILEETKLKKANDVEYGIVKTFDIYKRKLYNIQSSVISFNGIVDLREHIHDESVNLNNENVVSNLDYFEENLFHINNSLYGIHDVVASRCNLQLHPFATSGMYNDLKYYPTYISDFINDVPYFGKYNDLSEIHNQIHAQSNLEIRNVSHQNATSVDLLDSNNDHEQTLQLLTISGDLFLNTDSPILQDITNMDSLPYVYPISSNHHTVLHKVDVAKEVVDYPDNLDDINLNHYGFVKLNIDDVENDNYDKVPSVKQLKNMFEHIRNKIFALIDE